MMFTEQKIRNYVRKFLLENEQTRRPGRGGYKREIQAAGALAQKNPAELMKRLGVTNVSGKNDIEKLNSLLSQAVSGTNSSDAMKNVFGDPQPRRDKQAGYEGIRVPVTVIPPRDARKYLEHTLVGAQLSRAALFVDDIQIEILGNDVLLYFSPKPYSWGRGSGSGKKKQEPKNQPAQESNDSKKKRVIGEPDLNPDRDDKSPDEMSLSAAVSGPITPIGTGPTYPDKPQKKPKSAAEITARAFGGIDKKKKKKKNKN